MKVKVTVSKVTFRRETQLYKNIPGEFGMWSVALGARNIGVMQLAALAECTSIWIQLSNTLYAA